MIFQPKLSNIHKQREEVNIYIEGSYEDTFSSIDGRKFHLVLVGQIFKPTLSILGLTFCHLML